MGVSEKADLDRDMEECLGGVEFPENVMIFIERRPMADHDILVHDHRALLQFTEKAHILFCDMISCPVNGRRSDGIECLDCVQAADCFIVVSPYHGYGIEEADFLDDFVRRCSVADQIAEKEVMVDFAFLGEFEKGQESFHVSVYVGENEISHRQ